jgi:AhpC/TSA family
MKIPLCVLSIIALAATSWAQPEIGKPAPDFTLKDAHGVQRSLSEYKGKYVVLEWVNFGCPFVRKHYDSKNMQNLQKEMTDKGVVWLSVCSSAPGKQGYLDPGAVAAAVKAEGSHATAYLIDSDGKVGGLYGARTTPDMYIINPEGNLIYSGAIDDKPTPDPASLTDAHNYVKTAITEALAGKPVSETVTKSYGCSVKY